MLTRIQKNFDLISMMTTLASGLGCLVSIVTWQVSACPVLAGTTLVGLCMFNLNQPK